MPLFVFTRFEIQISYQLRYGDDAEARPFDDAFCFLLMMNDYITMV